MTLCILRMLWELLSFYTSTYIELRKYFNLLLVYMHIVSFSHCYYWCGASTTELPLFWKGDESGSMKLLVLDLQSLA